jgi:transcriptional regulator with XRE-family HTH domain
MNKAERGIWLDEKLGETTKPFGRASAIASAIGVSHAVATGWLNGSLPRDIETAFAFCDMYGIDLREWATGNRKEASGSKQLRDRNEKIVILTREFERSLGFQLEDEQFLLAMSLVEEEMLDGKVNVSSKVKKWGQIFSFSLKK